MGLLQVLTDTHHPIQLAVRRGALPRRVGSQGVPGTRRVTHHPVIVAKRVIEGVM